MSQESIATILFAGPALALAVTFTIAYCLGLVE
jgi:hypothetical protein